jgi:hypothetical protein
VIATDSTHSSCQREYLKASTMKSAYSAYSGMVLIGIRDGQFFFDEVARALDELLCFFPTNESAFRGSRAVKSRNLLEGRAARRRAARSAFDCLLPDIVESDV